MSCFCGRTTLMPPIPCGTQISCNYPCNRSPPPCGHPRTNHSCHETEECPPCPFLTSKVCACGKRTLPNIRCSQEKVSCGTTCGKLLICGSHTCQRLCHSDECGPCQSICGKDRKLWYMVQRIIHPLLYTHVFLVFLIIIPVSSRAMHRRPVQKMSLARQASLWSVFVAGSRARQHAESLILPLTVASL